MIKQLSLEEARTLLAMLQQRGGASLPSIPLEEAFSFADAAPLAASLPTGSSAPPLQHLLPPSWHDFGRSVQLSVTQFANDTSASMGSTASTARANELPSSGALEAERARRHDALRTDGFAIVHPASSSARLCELCTRLAHGVTKVASELELPPLLVLAFDEAWEAVELLRTELASSLDCCTVLTHCFALDAHPPGSAGWSARRQSRRGGILGEDGEPSRVSVSLSLTGATVRTSCYYALPASADPKYIAAGDDDYDVARVVARAHQHVRALPIESGHALVCSPRLAHWASAHAIDDAGASGNDECVLSLRLMLSQPHHEPPLLRWPCALPPLEVRLAVIALWLLIDHHRKRTRHRPTDDSFPGLAGTPTALTATQLPLMLGLLQGYADHLADSALQWTTHAGAAAGTGVGTALQAALAACLQDVQSPSEPDELVASLVASTAEYIWRQRGLSLSPALARVTEERTARARDAAAQPSAVCEAPLALDVLTSAMTAAAEPVVFRGGWDAARAAQFRREFEAHAASSDTQWQSLGAGRMRLHRVWTSPGMRIEHALDALPDGATRDGPLDALLRDAPAGSAAWDAARTAGMMRAAAGRSGRAVQREPAFVTAPSAEQPPGRTAASGTGAGESLAMTHFDEYTNMALLLIGAKRWLLLPPGALAWEHGPRSHSPNERLDVSFESHPHLPWRQVVQRPGDVLVVPTGWWHRVASARDGSALLNLWCD